GLALRFDADRVALARSWLTDDGLRDKSAKLVVPGGDRSRSYRDADNQPATRLAVCSGWSSTMSWPASRSGSGCPAPRAACGSSLAARPPLREAPTRPRGD